jgi:hypothetical protein
MPLLITRSIINLKPWTWCQLPQFLRNLHIVGTVVTREGLEPGGDPALEDQVLPLGGILLRSFDGSFMSVSVGGSPVNIHEGCSALKVQMVSGTGNNDKKEGKEENDGLSTAPMHPGTSHQQHGLATSSCH